MTKPIEPCRNAFTVCLDSGKDLDTIISKVKTAGGKVVIPKTYLSKEGDGSGSSPILRETGSAFSTCEAVAAPSAARLASRRKRMTEITDDYMREMFPKTREYSAVILRKSHAYTLPGAEKIVWEHGRRNFALRAEGILAIVCPVRDGSEVSGFGIFNGTVDEIRRVMDEDPGVKAGVFVYEIHACRGFPGDRLPEKP